MEGQAISIAVERGSYNKTRKAVFAVGERIGLAFWLKNFGASSVYRPYFAHGGEPGLLGYSLRVELPDGTAIPITAKGRETLNSNLGPKVPPDLDVESRPPSGTILRHGEMTDVGRELTALYDLGPGTYFVTARRRIVKPGGRLSDPPVESPVEAVSNTVEIEITGPDLEQRLNEMGRMPNADSYPALDLRKMWITDSILDRVKHMPRLRRLSLADTHNISETAIADLVKSLPNLDDLCLANTPITDAVLERVGGLSKLRSLDLTKTKATDRGLKSLRAMAQLELLWIGYDGVTDAGLEQLQGLKNLEWLDISGPNGVTDAGLRCLTRMTELRRLDLGDGKITDAGLATLKSFANLEYLALGSQAITDAGLRNLEAMTQLDELTLRCPNLTDAGLKSLKGLTRLRRLTLGCPKVSDSGLAQLRTLVNLDHLEITSDNVTKSGVDSLEDALPDCNITVWPAHSRAEPHRFVDVVAALVETIIRLWDDAAYYDQFSLVARQRAQGCHPDRLAPLCTTCSAASPRNRRRTELAAP